MNHAVDKRHANLVDEQVVAEGVQSPRPLDGRIDALQRLVNAALAFVDVVVLVVVDPRPVVQVHVAVAVLVVGATVLVVPRRAVLGPNSIEKL